MSLPIAERLLRIFTLRGSETIYSEVDLERQTIAFLGGTITEESIRKLYHVPFEARNVSSYAEAAKLIQNKEVRGFIYEAVSEPAFNEYDFIQSQIVFPMVHTPVSMTTMNDELKPIISVVNKYILHFTEQGGNVL
jgi:hypothetical protein